MQETITSESLFCDYYAQWVKTYKEGAIRDVTMGKYRLTQSWLGKLIPELDNVRIPAHFRFCSSLRC